MYSQGNSWLDEVVIRQHRQELLKEAEHSRLVRQALDVRPSEDRGVRLQARAAIWLGSHFVDWGNALLAFSPKEQVCEQGC